MSEEESTVAGQDNHDRNVRPRQNVLRPKNDENIDISRITIKTLDELKDENVERRKTGIYLQLLRIVSGSSTTQGKYASSQYNYFNRSTKERTSQTFTRLFLFSDYKAGNGQVTYIIESKHQNKRLWMRNPVFRDSGDITIGSVILILNPPPIKLFLGGEIPILETRGGCVLMECPSYQPTVIINYRIEENITRSFVSTDVGIELKAMFAEESKCSVFFCDRQRCIELVRNSKACGCYSMQNRLSSIVLCFDLVLNYGNNRTKKLHIENFSSLSFCRLFMDNDLPSSLTCNSLDNTNAHTKLEDCIDSVLQCVNKSGGFTVVGWYKRGEIVDVSKETNNHEEKVVASEIGYHVVVIKPTYPDLLSASILNERKYRVEKLQEVEGNE